LQKDPVMFHSETKGHFHYKTFSKTSGQLSKTNSTSVMLFNTIVEYRNLHISYQRKLSQPT